MAQMKIPKLKKKNRSLEELGEDSLGYALNWDKFQQQPAKKSKNISDDLAADLAAIESQIMIAERVKDFSALPALRRQLKAVEDDIIQAEARGQVIQDLQEGLAVYKDYRGQDRWVTLSSNAFRDRDREIVSTKSLERDVNLSDQTKNYGPLRWWHVPGADLGPCDFRMMSGRVLVESGTFKSAEIAARIKAAAPNLQVSIGFTHPASEPDNQGVYHNIRVFERSLVPAGRAANPWTTFSVKGESKMASLQEKLDTLKDILGDSELAQEILIAAQDTEKSADNSGADYKELREAYKAPADKKMDEAEDPEEAAAETEADEAAELATEPTTQADAEGDEESEDVYVSELTVPEFATMLAEALDEVFGPYMAKMGAQPAQAAPAEQPAAAKEFTRVAAAMEKMAERLAALEGENQRLKERIEKFDALPRAIKREFIASKDDSTIVPEGNPLRNMAPGPDPLTDFTNFVIGKQ